MTLLISCAKKQGQTSSKIKIFSSGAFSAGSLLETKANNGMIIYGYNSEGKSFSQFLQDDSSELILPNGTWNFYAVAWEEASPTSKFQGITSCGKQLGIKLAGKEINLNITISNAGCNDSDFSTGVSTVTGKYTLPYHAITSCRNFSTTNSYSSICSRYSGDLTTNIGYATYVKIVMPQYRNLQGGVVNLGSPIESGCLEIDSNGAETNTVTSLNAPGTVLASSLSFPDQNPALKYKVRLFFSKDACEASTGFVDVPANNSTPDTRIFMGTPVASIKTKARLFVLNDEKMVCRDNRLTTDQVFAGGRGTVSSPYLICTKDQFNLIDTKFSDGTYYTQNKSFDLLADIDFSYGTFNPIGGALNTTASRFGGPNSATKIMFDGNNHNLDNIKIECLAQDSVGIFRSTQYTYFQNIVINKAVIDCEARSTIGTISGDDVGSFFRNISLSSHVGGALYTGGVVGHAQLSSFDRVFVNSIVKSTSNTVGGIAGRLYNDTAAVNMNQITFKGEVKAVTGNVGGISGSVACAFANCISASNLIIRANIKSSSGDIGGMFGNIFSSGSMLLENSYFEGTISQTSDGSYSGNMGGLAGAVQVPTTVNNVYILAQKYVGALGTSIGGVYGFESVADNTTCNPQVFYFDDSFNFTSGSGTNCNYTNRSKNMADFVTATTLFATNNPATWMSANGGPPRLVTEATDMNQVSWLNIPNCDGHYTTGTMAGSGTIADPYLICSDEQFLAITPGNKYKILRNIFLNKVAPQTPFPAGNYFIDGSNNFIAGYSFETATTGFSGMFSILNFPSLIKNVTLFNPETSMNGSYTTDLAVGLLTGKNMGTINNVKIEFGKITGNSGFSSTLDTGTENSIGGLVGLNEATGVIEMVSTKIDMPFSYSSLNSNSASPYIGGFAGRNLGVIRFVKHTGTFTLAPDYIAANENYGAFAANNAGTLQGIEIGGSVNLIASTPTTVSKFGGIVYVNSGLISDLYLKSDYSFSNVTSISSEFMIPSVQASSQLTRAIISPLSLAGLVFSTSSEIVPTTNITESFCINATITGCMNSTNGQFTFTSGLFTAGSYVTNSNTWNMIDSILPDNNYSWQFNGSNQPPTLMKTGGGWNELDFGI